MHQLNILHKILSSVMHNKRLNTLKQMISASFSNSVLSVTQLGRAIDAKLERSGIRKADRFLSNINLQKEYPKICHKLCELIIGKTINPWIIVDWTKVPNRNYHILRAALVSIGRAITLYEEVHSEKKLGNSLVHKKFLISLRNILPVNCIPIIITDAGFGVSWFKHVLKLKWHYVGRVRGNKYCIINNNIQIKCIDIPATTIPKYVGQVYLTKEHKLSTYMYIVKNKHKNRHSFNLSGKPKKGFYYTKYSTSAKGSWCLVTSCNYSSVMPKKIMKIYQMRMQVEEGIRDLKSSKYGFGFEHMYSYKPHRILILLLIAMLAAFIAWVTGYSAENKKMQYNFQANSIKSKRVLSLFFLGIRIIKKSSLRLTLYDFNQAILAIQIKFKEIYL